MTTIRRRRSRSSRGASTPSRAPGAAPAPIRLTRVRAALKRIASGYYDRDDVRDRLASVVLAELRKS